MCPYGRAPVKSVTMQQQRLRHACSSRTPVRWSSKICSSSSRSAARNPEARRLRATWTETAAGSWVAHSSTPSQPRAVCHFIGGAFAGAAPQVVYNLLLEILADSGYTVVATPYAVTFRHAECAAAVKQQLQDTLAELRASSTTSWMVPATVPTLGVGHSNGALLHLLLGSLYPEETYAANVVMSYNNKQVSDAIPIPGFLAGLQPTVQAARSSTVQLPMQFPDPASLLQQAAAALPEAFIDRRLVARASLALEQLGSVVGEVGDGTTDFTPPPAESRKIVGDAYAVPATLMVRFTDDSIDESLEMSDILRTKRVGQSSQLLSLPGTHLTPCGGDVRWQSGPSFTPADAVAMAVRMASQTDIRRLAARVVEFLDKQAAAYKPAAQPKPAVAAQPVEAEI